MRLITCLAVLLLLCCAAPKGPAIAYGPPTKRIAGVHAPEDLLALPETPWIVVSNLRDDATKAPGWLAAIDRRDADAPARPLFPLGEAVQGESNNHCPGPPDITTFAPQGLAVRDDDLLVVNHGGRESIELFIIEEGPKLTWRDCLTMPPNLEGNSVTVLADGRIAVTGMMDPADAAAADKAVKGEVSGRVVVWDGYDWQTFGERGFAFANGIAGSKSHVFITEWTGRKLWRFALDGSLAQAIDLDFLPDNLRWTPWGSLLVTGQRVPVADFIACNGRDVPCPLSFTVVEVDPKAMTARPRIVSDGFGDFGGATSAIVVEAELWVGSVVNDAIGRYPLLP